MNKQKYHVEHTPTFGYIRVEIDLDFTAERGKKTITLESLIKEMVDFWTGSEDRLEENEFDYIRTFLKQLCKKVMGMLCELNLNTAGVIAELKGEEGWCPMDGSCGILLLDVEDPDFSTQADYEIETY